MIKMFLMICIFLICTIMGFQKGNSYKIRLSQLKEYKNMVVFLQNEILYNNTPLPQALLLTSSKVDEPLKNMMKKSSQKILEYENEENLFQIVQTMYKDNEEEFYFNESDKKSIGDFIKYLGNTGVFGQEKIFNLAIQNIDLNIDDADKSAKKNIKLCRELGVCFGAMIAILII